MQAYEISYFLLQVMWKSVSRENPYQVLQVHVRCVWMCNEIEGLYDKIIITVVPIKLYRKKYHSFVAIIIGIVTRAAHS